MDSQVPEAEELAKEIHGRCHEGRWFRRAKELEQERDEARAERDRLANLLHTTRDANLVDMTADRDSWQEQCEMARTDALHAGAELKDAEKVISAALAREKGLREALEMAADELTDYIEQWDGPAEDGGSVIDDHAPDWLFRAIRAVLRKHLDVKAQPCTCAHEAAAHYKGECQVEECRCGERS